jgi:hypothetical protein
MTPTSFNLPLGLRFARQAKSKSNRFPPVLSHKVVVDLQKKAIPRKKANQNSCKSPPNRCATKQAWMHLPHPLSSGVRIPGSSPDPLWKKARKSYKSFFGNYLAYAVSSLQLFGTVALESLVHVV